MPSVFPTIARARRGRTPWLARLRFGENAIVLNVGFLALGAATFSLGAALRGRVAGLGPAALALAGSSTAGNVRPSSLDRWQPVPRILERVLLGMLGEISIEGEQQRPEPRPRARE